MSLRSSSVISSLSEYSQLNMLPVLIPASVGAQHRTSISSDMVQAVACFSSTFRSADRELVLQCSMMVFCPFSSLIAP